MAIDANSRTENRVRALETVDPGPVRGLPDCGEDLFSSATAGRPCLTFLFTPNTSAAARAVMARVASRNAPLPVPASRYLGLATRAEADDYMVEAQRRGQTVLGAVHFLATPDRGAGGGRPPPATAAAATATAAAASAGAPPPASFSPSTAFQYAIMTNTSGKYFRGVYQNPNAFFELPMQSAVSREAARELLGGDATPEGRALAWRLGVAPFPHPRLTVVTLVEYVIAPFTFASCMFAFVAQLGAIVGEKESGLRQALRTMGMRDSAYWLSWLFFDAAMALATSLVLVASGAAMRFPMFVNNDFGLLLGLFWVFMQAMSGLAYALAAFVHRAQAAVYVGFMVFLTGWMLQGVVAAGLPYTPFFFGDAKGRVFFWAFSLLPWNPLIKALLDLARAAPAEASPGLRWSERFSYCRAAAGDGAAEGGGAAASAAAVDPLLQFVAEDCVMSVGWVIVNEAALALLYGLLAVYLDNVVANELGVRRPLLYFLDPGYWRPKAAAAGTALARVMAQEAAAVSAAAAGGARGAAARAAAAAAAQRRSSLGGVGGGPRRSGAGGGHTRAQQLRRALRRALASARRAAWRTFGAATGADGGGLGGAASAPRPPPLADHVEIDELVALEEAKMRQLLYARGSAALAAARAAQAAADGSSSGGSSSGGGGSSRGSRGSRGGGGPGGHYGKGGSGGGGGKLADGKHGAHQPGRFGAARDDAELAAAFEALQRSGAALGVNLEHGARGGGPGGAGVGANGAGALLLPQGSIGIVQARVTVTAGRAAPRPATLGGHSAGGAAAAARAGSVGGHDISAGGGGGTLSRRGGGSSGGGGGSGSGGGGGGRGRTTGSGGGVIVPLEALGLSPDDDDLDRPARTNGSGYAVELYGLRKVFHQRAAKPGGRPAAGGGGGGANGGGGGGAPSSSLRERAEAVLRAADGLLRRAGLRRPLERLNSGDALEAGSPSASGIGGLSPAEPGAVHAAGVGGVAHHPQSHAAEAAAAAADAARRKNEFWAVRGSWFGIREGELFCLLGPNGAGKTTTINCLTGALPVSGGEALVYGHPIACGATGMDRVRQLMGVCPQFDVQWGELTGREHLLIYGHVKGLRPSLVCGQAKALLDKVALGKSASARSAAYSGGMRRRLSVAIALLGDPKIVYLDEPTTGMDPISRRYVWDIIQEAKRGRAIVLTTHSMEEADVLGDRIGIMARGRLQAVGSALRLKQTFGAGYQVTVAVGGGVGVNGGQQQPQQQLQPLQPLQRSAGLRRSAAGAAATSAFAAAAAAAGGSSGGGGSTDNAAASASAPATLVSDPIAGPLSAYASLFDRSAPVRALFRDRLDVDPLTDEAAGGGGGGGGGGGAPAASGRYLNWLVPRDREGRLAAFLGELEARARELNVTDVQLSLTSLEEVFLTISRRAEIEAARGGGGLGTVAVPVPSPLGGAAAGGRVLEVPVGEERVVDSATGAAYAVKWAQDERGRLVVLDVRRVGADGAPLPPSPPVVARGGGGRGQQQQQPGAVLLPPLPYSTVALGGGGGGVRVASVAATPLTPRTLGTLKQRSSNGGGLVRGGSGFGSGALARGNSAAASLPPPPLAAGNDDNGW